MITSTQNKRIVNAVRLKKRSMREKDRRFLVEGVQGVTEALASGGPVNEVFHTVPYEARLDPALEAARLAGVPATAVSADVMAHLTSTVTPQGVVGVVDFVDVPLGALPADGPVALLYEVRDPGNAGTILRSADASGAAGVVFTRSSVDVYNAKAVRATAGSLFHVPVAREVEAGPAVEDLRARGFRILAASADGEGSVYDMDLTGPVAVLFGNEAHGLPHVAASLADRTVRVPISGHAESLNLAAAATIILFEAARQRAGAGPGVPGRSPAAEPDPLALVVSGAAHDIRSPLTALKGFVSTLLSRWDRLNDEQRLMMLQGVGQDGNRMGIIVTQLVDAARLTSDTLELALAPTDLMDVARQAMEEAMLGLDVQTELTGDRSIALVDPTRVRTILVALIEAAKWWGEEGPVRLHVSANPPSVEVGRKGSTLEEGESVAMFRPRAPGTGGGSKVGLFVARGLAEANGGRLVVTERPDVAFRLIVSSVPSDAG